MEFLQLLYQWLKKNKILTQYPSYVENMLFKSLLKMKKASDEGVIDYLIIKCMKYD